MLPEGLAQDQQVTSMLQSQTIRNLFKLTETFIKEHSKNTGTNTMDRCVRQTHLRFCVAAIAGAARGWPSAAPGFSMEPIWATAACSAVGFEEGRDAGCAGAVG